MRERMITVMPVCYTTGVTNQSIRPLLRFAPSPTGHLHLGHALSAFENERWAKAAGGRLLLRIEDIDTTRCRPEFVAALLEDLAWLGLPFEPSPRRQSEHFDDYRQALDSLAGMGLLYRSYASRAEIAAATDRPGHPRDPDGTPLYPRAALARADDPAGRDPAEPFALRLDMTAALAKAGPLAPALSWQEQAAPRGAGSEAIPAAPERWGDVVLGRKEFPASYHLAVVADDALQGITHVVRGRDLYHATGLHRLLQALLGLPEPVYHHHGLLLGPDGEKLSKSARSTSLRALRADGITPAQIRDMAAA